MILFWKKVRIAVAILVVVVFLQVSNGHLTHTITQHSTLTVYCLLNPLGSSLLSSVNQACSRPGSCFLIVLSNLAVVGGLVLLLAETTESAKTMFAGIPTLEEVNHTGNYLQLAGRILVVLMYLTSIRFDGIFRILVEVVALGKSLELFRVNNS